jgi:hypothetical protein
MAPGWGNPMNTSDTSNDSGEELKVGDKLEILIFSAAPENRP